MSNLLCSLIYRSLWPKVINLGRRPPQLVRLFLDHLQRLVGPMFWSCFVIFAIFVDFPLLLTRFALIRTVYFCNTFLDLLVQNVAHYGSRYEDLECSAPMLAALGHCLWQQAACMRRCVEHRSPNHLDCAFTPEKLLSIEERHRKGGTNGNCSLKIMNLI